MIDSQSVKTTEAGGPCGYDAGKKCRILTDTNGLLVAAIVHQINSLDIEPGCWVLRENIFFKGIVETRARFQTRTIEEIPPTDLKIEMIWALYASLFYL